jgi:hypothetical protein
MKSENTIDGGFCALVGFLYQFIGSIGYFIKVQKSIRKPGEDQDVEFLLEAYDQDAAVDHSQHKRTLVQFKYSATGNTIDPNKLQKICEQFKKARERADGVNKKETDFRLVTNQNFTPYAQKILDDAKQLKNKYGQTTLTADTKEILPLLEVEQREIWQDIEDIQNHMAGFGVLPEEAAELITNTVGHYFNRVTNNALSVSQHELYKHLIGFSGARQLQDPNVVDSMREQLTIAKEDLNVPAFIQRRHVEKAIQKALFENHQALILLEGQGGNGKSMTMCRVIEAAMPFNKFESPLGEVPFGVVCHSSEYADTWLSQHVEGWRGRTTGGSELFSPALCRLHMTRLNHNSGPILLIGLDGLDEIRIENRAAVDRLMDWFRSEQKECRQEFRLPRAVLVATCRKREEFEKIHVRAYSHLRDNPEKHHISVGPFNEIEFVLAMMDLASGCPPERRIVYAHLLEYSVSQIRDKQQVDSTFSIEPSGANAGFSSANSEYRQIHQDSSPEILALEQTYESGQVQELLKLAGNNNYATNYLEVLYPALLHPIMWRCFDQAHPLLTTASSGSDDKKIADGQMAALDGNTEARKALSLRLIKWFQMKCTVRHQISAYYSRNVLKAAALATLDLPPSSKASKMEHWMMPAAQKPLEISYPTSETVFEEALCSGLIEIDAADTWSWRHSFLKEELSL